ncbi:MAG TPA: hypothetical protein VIO43_12250 [Lutibacter sp.]
MDEKEKALQSQNITRQSKQEVKYTKNYVSKSQQQRVYESLFLRPSTMKEVSIETDIDRSSICRYVVHLRNDNKIVCLRKRFCRITKHIAGEYTTNPEFFPKLNNTFG